MPWTQSAIARASKAAATSQTQRELVYGWEESTMPALFSATWGSAWSAALVGSLWARYAEGLPRPRIVFPDGAWAAHGDRRRISLPPWARSRGTIAHETAHALEDHDGENHGPVFVGVLIVLLGHVANCSAIGMLRAATRHGLCVAMPVAERYVRRAPVTVQRGWL